jgi:sugar lactone lactonase YvrE
MRHALYTGIAFLALSISIRAQDGYIFTTLAGQAGITGSNDASGTSAQFYNPIGIAVDSAGTVYVADEYNFTIRKISATGVVSTLAGKAGTPGNFDGNGGNARFGSLSGAIVISPNGGGFYTVGFGPRGVAVDSSGVVYVADSGNMTIRKILPNGTVSTFAGGLTTSGFLLAASTNGTGSAAAFAIPQSIAIDSGGNLFVGESTALRKVTPGAVVTTVSFGSYSSPQGIAADGVGTIFVADTNGFTIRKIAPNAVASTIAGSPGNGGSNDGNGSDARFGRSPPLSFLGTPVPGSTVGGSSGPCGIAVDSSGTIFVADTWNHTIRKISTAGVVTTIGGAAGQSGTALGSGNNTRFYCPQGIAVDAAGNLYIADTANQRIVRGTPAATPQIQTQPQSQSVNPGQAFALSVAATGNPAPTFQWSKDGANISGATNASLSITSATTADSGSYTVTITNAAGSVTSAAATISVGSVPTISTQPVAQSLLGGQALTLSVAASGDPAPTFQWKKDSVAIASATSATYTVANAQASDAGSYTVAITNAAGSVTSNPVTVAVNTSRISNLSILSTLSPNAPLLTVGFVVSGGGKTLLARAAGPALGQLGVGGFLADPRIGLFSGSTAIASNDNWGTAANAAQVAATEGQLGGFAFSTGSADAALLTNFDAGGYSAQVTGPAGASGLVLVELYDANPTIAARLINVSASAQVGTDGAVLIAGFIVTGNAQKTLLIRAIGPTLGTFGVGGVLADPKLDLFGAGNALIATNDNWGGDANQSATFSTVGAFALANPNSKDAVLLVTLDPGNYSAKVSGVGGSTGLALIEIYEVK